MICLLSEEQKENHVITCQDLQARLETDPEFSSKVIRGEERHGFTSMSQKPSSSHLFEKACHHHVQKKQGKVIQI
jgi:hypothetical protein